MMVPAAWRSYRRSAMTFAKLPGGRSAKMGIWRRTAASDSIEGIKKVKGQKSKGKGQKGLLTPAARCVNHLNTRGRWSGEVSHRSRTVDHRQGAASASLRLLVGRPPIVELCPRPGEL